MIEVKRMWYDDIWIMNLVFFSILLSNHFNDNCQDSPSKRFDYTCVRKISTKRGEWQEYFLEECGRFYYYHQPCPKIPIGQHRHLLRCFLAVVRWPKNCRWSQLDTHRTKWVFDSHSLPECSFQQVSIVMYFLHLIVLSLQSHRSVYQRVYFRSLYPRSLFFRTYWMARYSFQQ